MYREYANHYYELLLGRDERHWGYCECTSDHEGYNVKYDCCGNGCDWTAPSITIKKISESSFSFKGVEKDIWELEEKWKDHLHSFNETVKQNKLNRIEEQLARLQKEKEELLRD
jgi:hypothetical protein